jgi:hypothetical protein
MELTSVDLEVVAFQLIEVDLGMDRAAFAVHLSQKVDQETVPVAFAVHLLQEVDQEMDLVASVGNLEQLVDREIDFAQSVVGFASEAVAEGSWKMLVALLVPIPDHFDAHFVDHLSKAHRESVDVDLAVV